MWSQWLHSPGGYSALWWYIYVPRPRPPVHISTVVLELIHSMPKGRSKALLFIPYRSSARSGLGSIFKLENAPTFRSEALLEPVLESHPRLYIAHVAIHAATFLNSMFTSNIRFCWYQIVSCAVHCSAAQTCSNEPVENGHVMARHADVTIIWDWEGCSFVVFVYDVYYASFSK